MKNILILNDFSERADFAYILAKKIADKTGAQLHTLSVIAAPGGSVFDKDGNFKTCQDYDTAKLFEAENTAKKAINEWVEAKGRNIKTQVKIGVFDKVVLKYVEDNQIDLVVKGIVQNLALKSIFANSKAEHLARELPVPVLTLKCNREEWELKDILLASEFDGSEKLDLSIIKIFQDAFDAKLHLLKVNTKKDFFTTRQNRMNMQHFAEVNELKNVSFHVYCDETVEKGIENFSIDKDMAFVAIGQGKRKRFFKKPLSSDLINTLFQPVLSF